MRKSTLAVLVITALTLLYLWFDGACDSSRYVRSVRDYDGQVERVVHQIEHRRPGLSPWYTSYTFQDGICLSFPSMQPAESATDVQLIRAEFRRRAEAAYPEPLLEGF